VALAGFDPREISVTATPREIIVKASHKLEQEKSSDKEASKLRWVCVQTGNKRQNACTAPYR
jgi:HSP20 family molecular chaperone IbpA